MLDLDEALKQIERNTPPDLWSLVKERELEPSPPFGGTTHSRRWSTILMAAVISVLALGFAWKAFGSSSGPMGPQAEPSLTSSSSDSTPPVTETIQVSNGPEHATAPDTGEFAPPPAGPNPTLSANEALDVFFQDNPGFQFNNSDISRSIWVPIHSGQGRRKLPLPRQTGVRDRAARLCNPGAPFMRPLDLPRRGHWPHARVHMATVSLTEVRRMPHPHGELRRIRRVVGWVMLTALAVACTSTSSPPPPSTLPSTSAGGTEPEPVEDHVFLTSTGRTGRPIATRQTPSTASCGLSDRRAGDAPIACLGSRIRSARGRVVKTSGTSSVTDSPSRPAATGAEASTSNVGATHEA